MSIRSFFKKLLKLFLVALIIVVAFYLPEILTFLAESIGSFLGFVPSAGLLESFASIPLWVSGAIGVGLAYLIAPGATTELITDVAKGVGAVVSTVVSTVAKATSSLWLPIALGLGAFFLLRKKKNDEKVEVELAPASGGASP